MIITVTIKCDNLCAFSRNLSFNMLQRFLDELGMAKVLSAKFLWENRFSRQITKVAMEVH